MIEIQSYISRRDLIGLLGRRQSIVARGSGSFKLRLCVDHPDCLSPAYLPATSNFRLKIRIDIVSDGTRSTAEKSRAIGNLTVTDRRLAQTDFLPRSATPCPPLSPPNTRYSI